MCTSLLNRLLNPIDFMCAEIMRLMHELCKCPHWCQNSTRLHSSVISLEIIHYDNITLFQVRDKRLLNIIEKDLSRQYT